MTRSQTLFLDHHSTTPVDERVLAQMLPYFSTEYGNAASRAHEWGRHAERAVEQARADTAALIGALSSEIIFTSGATESNNLALRGVCEADAAAGFHILTVATEHKSILDTAKHLSRSGVKIEFCAIDRQGRADLKALEGAIASGTKLISVMLANNEVGTVQDVAAIGKLAQDAGVLFHCDAAQGLGYLPLDVKAANIDLLSISAHKMYGPKGVGALFVSRRLLARDQIHAQIHGGGHEQGLRSGTLNVPGIVGLGAACAIMRSEGREEAQRLERLRNKLQSIILRTSPDVQVNGSQQSRHPGNLNISVAGVDAGGLLLELNQQIAVSSGAACSSAKDEGSYVLRALGVPDALAKASVRFGLGRHTQEKDVYFAAEVCTAAITKLRKTS